jgi:PRTRC genetic system protein C
MTTLYKYITQGGREVVFEDPTDQYKPEDVRQHWAQSFPELANATTTETTEDGKKVVTFAKKVGTKGGKTPHRFQVNGEVVWLDGKGREKVDDLDMRVESSNGEEDAAFEALRLFSEQHGIIAFWSEDIFPEVEDLGEVPVDVIMRRQGQPMLFVI